MEISTDSRVNYCLLIILRLSQNVSRPLDLQTLRLRPLGLKPRIRRLADRGPQTIYLTLNLNVVLERNGSSGVRMTDGNEAWLGLSG